MPTRSGTTFRRSLILNLTALLVVLGLAITVTQALFARKSIRNLSGALTTATLAQTERGLTQFFQPVNSSLRLAVRWGDDYNLVTLPPESIYAIFGPFLDQVTHISAALLANEHGREIMVLRNDDGTFYIRDIDPARQDARARVITFSPDGNRLTDSREEIEYTPVRRPWFVGAIEALEEVQVDPGVGPVYWTEPYTFFTTQEPGITAAKAFEAGGTTWVVAFDVLLQDISAFTTNTTVSEGGRVIVADERGRVIGLPRDFHELNASQREPYLLRNADQLDLPVLAAAADAFGFDADFTAPTGADPGNAIRYTSGGRTYWAEYEPFVLANRTLWIAVVVPERDLIGNLNNQRNILIVVLIAILIAAIFRAQFLAARYAQPIESIAHAADRISKLKLDTPATAPTNVREIARLAAATERMRESLQNLLKLERDLQTARQIQQATFPENLPRLPGIQLAAYSEPAEETGGDSFDLIGLTSGVIGLDGTTEPQQDIVNEGDANAALLFLADATGHGVGPALSVTQARSMIRMGARLASPLDEIALHLNEQLTQDLAEGRFVTMWLGQLDAASGRLWSLSAGQGPLLLYRAASGTIEDVPVDTTPLGIVDPLPEFPRTILQLERGDVFVALSDGIFEAADKDDAMFGRDRVEACIRTNAAKSAEDILGALRAAVEEFTGDVPSRDDQTGIIIKRV
ncbi:MAG: SpoIIE family protein phosphatase [Phycisphaerales bacterium JB040]